MSPATTLTNMRNRRNAHAEFGGEFGMGCGASGVATANVSNRILGQQGVLTFGPTLPTIPVGNGADLLPVDDRKMRPILTGNDVFDGAPVDSVTVSQRLLRDSTIGVRSSNGNHIGVGQRGFLLTASNAVRARVRAVLLTSGRVQSSFGLAVKGVVTGGSECEVTGIHATWRVAGMQHEQIAGITSGCQEKGDAVSPVRAMTVTESPVAGIPRVRIEQPAVVGTGHINVTPKAEHVIGREFGHWQRLRSIHAVKCTTMASCTPRLRAA